MFRFLWEKVGEDITTMGITVDTAMGRIQGGVVDIRDGIGSRSREV